MENKELKEEVDKYCAAKRQIEKISKVCDEARKTLDKRAKQIFDYLREQGACFDISDCDKVGFNSDTFCFIQYFDAGDYDVARICCGTEECNVPFAALYDDEELAHATKDILDAQKKYNGFIDKITEDNEEFNREQCVYGKDSTMPCGICSAVCGERFEWLKKNKIKYEPIPTKQ